MYYNVNYNGFAFIGTQNYSSHFLTTQPNFHDTETMDATQTVSAATITGKAPRRGPSSAAAVNGVMLGLMGIMFGLSIVYLISRIVAMSRRVSQLEKQVKEAEEKAAPDEQGIAAIIQTQLNSAIERALQDEPDIPAFPAAPPPSPGNNHHHPVHRMQHLPAEMGILSPPSGVMDMLMHDMMGGGMPGMMVGMPHTHAHPPRPVSRGGASIVEILDDDDDEPNAGVEVEDGFDDNVDDEETLVARVPIPIVDATRDGITQNISQTPRKEVEEQGEAEAEVEVEVEAETEFSERVHDGGDSDSDAAVSWITSAMAPIADVVTALQDMEAEDAKRQSEEVEKRAKPVTRRITRSRRTSE